MNKQDDALQVLLIVRRRLLNKIGSVVMEQRNALLRESADSSHPFAAVPQLVELKKELAELDQLIAALAEVPTKAVSTTELAKGNGEETTVNDQTFERYITLVKQGRMEEGSRALAGVLSLSLDAMVTATRFFARSLNTDPAAAHRLALLCEHLGDWPDRDCVKALMKIFGLQAVEAHNALTALRTKKNIPERVQKRPQPNLVLPKR